MAKLPDFSKLAEKLDLDSLVSSVKSVLNPDSIVPEAAAHNPKLARLVELSVHLQHIAQVHQQQAKDIATLGKMLNALYKELEADYVASQESDESDEPEQHKPSE